MSNITFRGVTLDYPDLRRKEASVFVRVHFSSEWTKPVADAMGWEEMPACATSAKLEGSLTAGHFVLTPNDKKLKDFEVQLQCSRVEEFMLIRKTEDEKTVTRIRFVAIVEQQGAIQWLENWMRSVGEAPAALKVTYVEQAELDLQKEGAEVKATDEQRAAAMEIPTK